MNCTFFLPLCLTLDRRLSQFLLLLSPDRGVTTGAMQPPPGAETSHHLYRCAALPMHKAPMCTDITAGAVPDSIHSLWGHLLEEAPSPVPGVRRSAILLLLLFNIHRVFFLAPAGVESSQSCD